VGFRAQNRSELDTASPTPFFMELTPWRLLAAAALLLLAIGGSWKFAQRTRDNGDVSVTAADAAAVELVDAHIRALQPGH